MAVVIVKPEHWNQICRQYILSRNENGLLIGWQEHIKLALHLVRALGACTKCLDCTSRS